jgi:hypothetical protein
VSAPFTAADGKKARWRYAYDLVAARKPGDDVTLQELAELLELDWEQDSHALRSVMLDAKKRLEEDRKHTVKPVPKYGWKVITAQENLTEIEKRRRKASRATGRAARLIVATDREQLSPIERNQLDFNTRMVVAASSLHGRKPKSITELEKESKLRNVTQLPLRQQDTA